MRVLIAVTHLLGAGHLTRAAALARALAAAGHAVTLASGGAPAPLVRLDGVRLVQLEPLHVRGTAFSDLRDAAGEEAAPALLARRRDTLLEALRASAPDILVTELFPFGRRALADEFLALVAAARAREPRPLILASVRDILVAPGKPERVAQAHARVADLYDAVLVHGDPALATLDASWPVDAGLAARLRYTGYVDEGPAAAPAARAGTLVSAGSSAAGLDLLATACAAARQRPDLGWRILAGGGVPEAAFRRLRTGLAPGMLERARPDYRALLARSAVSVSACGYNTAVDLLATGTRAVLVPFEAGRETEQRLRAERLAARGLARILPEAALDPASLIAAVESVRTGPEPPAHGIRLDGAARSVALMEAMAAAGRGGKATGPDLAALREALDRQAALGRRVTVWWRDDDACAASPALDRLLALAAAAGVPLMLAAIPARLQASLGRRLAGCAGIALAVHGLAHANHAPPGAKPAEFGPHRARALLRAEAGEALARARAGLPEESLLPVFVPPWNRIAPDLAADLPGLGYAGLSAAPGAVADAALVRHDPTFVRHDATFDPVDWRGTRSLRPLASLIPDLARQVEAGGPVGLLTHHLAHDAALWSFLEALLPLLAGHPAVTFADPRHLFARGPVDAQAPPCSTVRQGARVP